jgi:hypothetical protein
MYRRDFSFVANMCQWSYIGHIHIIHEGLLRPNHLVLSTPIMRSEIPIFRDIAQFLGRASGPLAYLGILINPSIKKVSRRNCEKLMCAVLLQSLGAALQL